MYLPPIIRRLGDEQACDNWIGRAKAELAILKKLMALSSSPEHIKQQIRVVNPESDVIIRCYVGIGVNRIDIYVAPNVGEGNIDRRKCLCWPCFAFAIITKVYDMIDDDFLYGNRYTYDALVCVDGAGFVPYNNKRVRPAGHEKYIEGQFVLVTFDVIDITLDIMDCCAKKSCLATKFDNQDDQYLLILPFVVNPMAKWLGSNEISIESSDQSYQYRVDLTAKLGPTTGSYLWRRS